MLLACQCAGALQRNSKFRLRPERLLRGTVRRHLANRIVSSHMARLFSDDRSQESRVSSLSYAWASSRSPTRERGTAASNTRTPLRFSWSGTGGIRREGALRPSGLWRGQHRPAARVDELQT